MIKRLSENTLFILIMTIVFFPIGLYLIYRNKKLRKELMPQAIVLSIVSVGIIGYTLAQDWTNPILEVKAKNTYSVEDDFLPKDIITDYVINVSDNDTELTIEDVQIKNYKKLDLTTKGTQKIEFLVTDDNYNSTIKTADLVIK